MPTNKTRVPVALDDDDLATLNDLRGTYSRAAYLRELVTTEIKKRREQTETAKT